MLLENLWKIYRKIRRYYKINYKYERYMHAKSKSCYKNMSCWLICSFIFFISSILQCLEFDLMFFIQLIWWFRTHQIFKKFDQTKIFQILLYTLSNLFDSTNLIKLIWPCISDDLWIVDWFNVVLYHYFIFQKASTSIIFFYLIY